MRCRSFGLGALVLGLGTLGLLAACSALPDLRGAQPALASPGQHPAAATAQSGVQGLLQPSAQLEGVSEYRLQNGLRVLLFPDASVQTFTLNVTYFVGSRHEGYGEAGMAHLLEHMLFKGTATRADVQSLIESRGGYCNGTTTVDRTNYFEQLPASGDNLDFALALEADRMLNSRITAQDLATELSVVRNELELGETDPAQQLVEQMRASAFVWHGYGHPTIGNRSDLERVSAEHLRAFYARYYRPDSAMLVLAGRFDVADALARIERHFAPLQQPAAALVASYTEEPVQDGERTVALRRSGDVALVGLLYHTVARADPLSVPLEAAVHALASEPSGRLYQALVASGMASSVSGELHSLAEPGYAVFLAEVPADRPLEPVRDKMIEVIDGFAQPSAEELARFTAASRKRDERRLARSDSFAVLLSDYAAAGDWRLFFALREGRETVSSEAVAQAARQYFQSSNRTLGWFVPTAQASRSPLPARPDAGALVDAYRGRPAASEGEAFEPTPEVIEQRTARFALANGTQVALLPKQTRGAAVQAELRIQYGSEESLRRKGTAARLLPALLARGSQSQNYAQIRDALDALQASVEFSAERRTGEARVEITGVRQHFPETLALVAALLRRPALAAADFEIVRAEQLREQQAQLVDPIARTLSSAIRALLPLPPAAARYQPTLEESIEQLRAARVEDVRALHRELWGGGHAQLAVVGDFDVAAVKDVLQSQYADWRAPSPYQRVPLNYQPVAAVLQTIATPGQPLAFALAAQPLELRDDAPDYPALELAIHILGGAAQSRLNQRLREREGWSYNTSASLALEPLDAFGFVQLNAIAAPQNARRAEAGLLDELRRFLADGVTAAELRDAKQSYAEQIPLRLAKDAVLAHELARGLELGRSFAFEQRRLAALQAVTAEELLRVARKHLQPAAMHRILAGDPAALGQE